MKRLARVLALSLVGACAGNAPSARSTLFAELEARAASLHAEQTAAAELAAYRAERARSEAAPADAPERGDLESSARAYLEAAIARAEQSALAEQRLAVEQKLVGLEAELTRVDTARLAQARAQGLARTRAIADAEINRAYARLDLHPAKRPKLGKDEIATLTRALLGRAQLIALALEDSELDAASRAEAQSAIAAAKTVRAPDDALAAADRALTRVQILLAKLRQERGPNDAERGVLADALSHEKLSVSRAEIGLLAELGASAQANQALPGVCRIARVHPHGPVLLLGAEHDTAKLQATWKHAGCDAARLRVTHVQGRSAPAIAFPAY